MANINKEVDLKQLAEQLVNLKVLEVNKLATILKEEHGIEPEAAAPVVVANTSAKTEEKEKKTSFDVVLKSVGSAKLKVIQAIRKVTNLGIKEAKEVTDTLPSTVKKGIKEGEAQQVKSILEEAGAEVTLE